MKKYFIIPIVQTEGMYGYSAIAIDVSMSNIQKILDIQKTFKKVKEIDSYIQEIVYNLFNLNFYLLNENYEGDVDSVWIDSISDTDLITYQEEMDCTVDSPHIIINLEGVKIVYPAKHSDASLDGRIEYEEFEFLLSKLIE